MSDITELVIQLQNSSPAVRSDAVEVLAKTGDSRVVAPLITALQDESESVRGGALQGLKDIGAPAVPRLIVVLKNPDRQVRRKASCVIDNIGDELKEVGDFQAVDPLREALKDTAPNVRINVLHALDKFGETAAAALISALADPVVSVRRHAIAALEKTGSKRAIPQLEKMTKDEPEESVRQAAKRTLRKRRN